MVKKLVFAITIILFLLTAAPPAVADGIGGQSALLVKTAKNNTLAQNGQNIVNYNLKRRAIKRVLERYNSPLADSTDAFIDTCIKYDLDCYLLPSITGIESSFGKHLMPGTYNPFGWGRGLIYFESWDDGIDTVGKGLRENYINKGATTIDQIGAIYCEGNTWAGKVKFFKKAFEKEEQNHELYFSKNTVEL